MLARYPRLWIHGSEGSTLQVRMRIPSESIKLQEVSVLWTNGGRSQSLLDSSRKERNQNPSIDVVAMQITNASTSCSREPSRLPDKIIPCPRIRITAMCIEQPTTTSTPAIRRTRTMVHPMSLTLSQHIRKANNTSTIAELNRSTLPVL